MLPKTLSRQKICCKLENKLDKDNKKDKLHLEKKCNRDMGGTQYFPVTIKLNLTLSACCSVNLEMNSVKVAKKGRMARRN